MVRFPAGHHIQKHSHSSDRVEYVLEGEIEFEGEVVSTGGFSFVSAGTEYEYDIMKDTTILLVFNGPPGLTM
jgi:quercetin dioxygenase-like cupin family protein